MLFPRFRLRTLMIAVAIAGIVLAGLTSRPGPTALSCFVLATISPVLATLVYLARKLGINTLFR